jgi:hypothetical protein
MGEALLRERGGCLRRPNLGWTCWVCGLGDTSEAVMAAEFTGGWVWVGGVTSGGGGGG